LIIIGLKPLETFIVAVLPILSIVVKLLKTNSFFRPLFMIFDRFFLPVKPYIASLKMIIMKHLLWFLLLGFVACGGEKVQPPEEYMTEADQYAKWVDEKVSGTLAWRSLPEFNKGDSKMAAWVGYINGKPLMVRLFQLPTNETKWWLFADTSDGKVKFMKEETPLGERMVRNKFAYFGDSLVLAQTSSEPYESPYGELDFRLKGKEVNALFAETVAAVEADLKYLSPEANAARRENAQFFATGGKNSWTVVINPSISQVTFTEPDKEPRKFGYDRPTTGPKNESIYIFNSLNGKIDVSIFGKAFGSSDGRNYPYTVVVEDAGKSFAGCGVLLQ
jgi:hypothetical protein